MRIGGAVWFEFDEGLFFSFDSFYDKEKAIEGVGEGSWRQKKLLPRRIFFQG